MKKVYMFKMPFATKHFNKNQRVWVHIFTGSFAAQVVGRFRGRGRYVLAWVKWVKAEKDESLFPKIQKIEVSDDFKNTHQLWCVE